MCRLMALSHRKIGDIDTINSHPVLDNPNVERVHVRKVRCDGGSESGGHPVVFISLVLDFI